MTMTMIIEAMHATDTGSLPVVFTDEDLRLLQACLGFLSQAGRDPQLRRRLDELWWRLDRAGATPMSQAARGLA